MAQSPEGFPSETSSLSRWVPPSSTLAKGSTQGKVLSKRARHDDQCDMFHFWTQFIAYSAAKVMPALASRSARDNLGLDDY